jgi:hypothetical protein
MTQVTGLLLAWGNGDDAALEQLIPLVHAELRRIAGRWSRSAVWVGIPEEPAYLIGTSRFSSSNQFSTTLICAGASS